MDTHKQQPGKLRPASIKDPPMKTYLQKLIRHINHPVLHNSESLLRQMKKELLYWMANSFPI